ncbi:hypothetical protein ADT28_02455 [Xylella fastidiosa]|nr:hypothetical protein OY18_02265 [Xylella fastidiosa]OCA58686.1 hypothetical protein AA93_02290 [Xylella fastidiosa subsp. pauca 11399]ALR08260.2 hypothetical protein XFFB_02255 [Xylella fastidiosa]KXB15896.1 hypothetical protein ADT29_01970 [Xylella fastidiosa]KXB22358.1 hypothetical protein ADT28_02455 [Xylella fastidiosa]
MRSSALVVARGIFWAHTAFWRFFAWWSIHMQTISDESIKLIKFLEGLRLQAYLCEAGVLTIGYGETAPHVGPLNSRKGGSVAIKTLETIPVLVAAVVREIAQPRDCPACHGRGRVCVGMLMR